MSQQTTIRESVAIPLLKALITAILFGALTVTLYAISIQITGWRIFWSVASGCALISWLIFISSVPGKISKPGRIYSKTTKVKAQVIARDPSGAYMAGVWADIPIDINKLARAAQAVNSGSDFGYASMAGKHKPLSRSEYELLRDIYIKRGLAVWRDEDCHNRGVDLTLAGRSLFKRLEQLGDRSISNSPGLLQPGSNNNNHREEVLQTQTHKR